MSIEEQRIGEAIATWLDRKAQGEPVSLDTFCAGYPEIARELRKELLAFETMDARSTADLRTPPSSMPSHLSGYRLVRELGRGGMGCVFLAMDDKLNRPVAIKMLAERHHGNQRLRERFLQEARAMAQLSHPHIVRIYELGPDNEPPHFVMEYVEGRPLTEATGNLPLVEKVRLLLAVIRAVEFLHRRGFVHRDLKPANILVDQAMEPKVVDFGLALEVQEVAQRLTRSGELLVTPWYMSPEQARGESIDARSDVFALGVILYELLTGLPPFREEDLREQIRAVCSVEPELPRRLNQQVPGAIQDVCLQAIEKDPAKRYASAAEMARDLERFLAGEPVLAAPSSYSRRVESRIQSHLAEIEAWHQERTLQPAEYDRLRRAYDKLSERDDSWIMEARTLSTPQVVLYFGGWMVLAGAAIAALLQHSGWSGWAAAAVAWLAAIAPLVLGVHFWRHQQLRIAIAFLLSSCLILPVAWVITLPVAPQREAWEPLYRYKIFRNIWDLRPFTNSQFWWALLLSMPAFLGLRRFTRSSVFTLVTAVALALLSIVSLLRFGMLDWLADDLGRTFLYLPPIALVFFLTAFLLERSGKVSDAGYFYPLGVAFTLLGLSGVAAFHDPYAHWLKAAAPFTRGQAEYLFLLNAAWYIVLQELCDRFGTDQLRSVGRAFRFVLPGHIMGSLLFLGISASHDAQRLDEARFFQVLLPLAAAGFVFASIPKQMKNFFATGLFFFTIGVVRLANDWLRNQAAWPLLLLVAGIAVMLLAANYSRVLLKLRGR